MNVLGVTRVAVSVRVTPRANTFAPVSHYPGMVRRETGWVRHREAVTAVAERPVVAIQAFRSRKRRIVSVALQKVRTVRDPGTMTSRALVGAVTDIARCAVTHAVRLPPRWPVRDSKLAVFWPLSGDPADVAKIALHRDLLGSVTPDAVTHRRRPWPPCGRAMTDRRVTIGTFAAYSARSVKDSDATTLRGRLRNARVTFQARCTSRHGDVRRGNIEDWHPHAKDRVEPEFGTGHGPCRVHMALRARHTGMRVRDLSGHGCIGGQMARLASGKRHSSERRHAEGDCYEGDDSERDQRR